MLKIHAVTGVEKGLNKIYLYISLSVQFSLSTLFLRLLLSIFVGKM